MAAKLSASKDAYLQGASAENAALALAAHHESLNSDTLLRTMHGLNGSPMYALAVGDLLPTLQRLRAERPANRRAQRDFALRLFFARGIHAGREGVA